MNDYFDSLCAATPGAFKSAEPAVAIKQKVISTFVPLMPPQLMP